MEFEKNLKELEKITEKMSSGEIPLKESIKTFKKGMELIEECRKELTKAEFSVKKLVTINENEEIETEDFDTSDKES